LSELSRLALLEKLLGAKAGPGVVVGIGDDAAVLAPGGGSLVWTVDAAVEGVHFRRGWAPLRDIGWRSFMAAASDLGAMGASPRGALSALVLPADFGDAELVELAQGQSDAADALGTSVVGGNLSRGGELSLTTSLFGESTRPVLRCGASPGDVIALAGNVGLAAAGVEALQRGSADAVMAPAIDAWRRPRARIAEGLTAAASATAGIDLSDGLALDASRVAEASGVAVVLDASRLLAAAGEELARAAAALAVDPLDLALFGGEDYALFMAFPSDVPEAFVPIGRCEPGHGVVLVMPDGSRRAIEPRGFDHFAAG
jgi:thiamine-monophosphate kinase